LFVKFSKDGRVIKEKGLSNKSIVRFTLYVITIKCGNGFFYVIYQWNAVTIFFYVITLHWNAVLANGYYVIALKCGNGYYVIALKCGNGYHVITIKCGNCCLMLIQSNAVSVLYVLKQCYAIAVFICYYTIKCGDNSCIILRFIEVTICYYNKMR
jgi:hypothetical protein